MRMIPRLNILLLSDCALTAGIALNPYSLRLVLNHFHFFLIILSLVIFFTSAASL